MADRRATALRLPDMLRREIAPDAGGEVLNAGNAGKRFRALKAVNDISSRSHPACAGRAEQGRQSPNLLAGMFRPTAAVACWTGPEPLAHRRPDRADGHRPVLSDHPSVPDLTVFENVRVAVQPSNSHEINGWRPDGSIGRVNAQAGEILEGVGLGGMGTAGQAALLRHAADAAVSAGHHVAHPSG